MYFKLLCSKRIWSNTRSIPVYDTQYYIGIQISSANVHIVSRAPLQHVTTTHMKSRRQHNAQYRDSAVAFVDHHHITVKYDHPPSLSSLTKLELHDDHVGCSPYPRQPDRRHCFTTVHTVHYSIPRYP